MADAKEGGATEKSGRKVVLALLVAMFGVFAALVWLAVANNGGVGGDPASKSTAPSAAVASGAGGSARGDDPVAVLADGGRIDRSIHDRRVHDELRKRILAGWAASSDEDTAEAARAGRLPARPSETSPLTKDYIQQVVREDFFPMAKGCYEELLKRNDAAAGRIEFTFKIVGDEKSGGILEDIETAAEGGISDEKLLFCMRESLATLSFAPPPKGSSYTTVTYPVSFSPGDDPPDE